MYAKIHAMFEGLVMYAKIHAMFEVSVNNLAFNRKKLLSTLTTHRRLLK
jgi:hypothetical protein